MIVFETLLQTLLQAGPVLSDDLFRWVANNGLAVVFLFSFFGLFVWVIRKVLDNLVKQIGDAVRYFTAELGAISKRNEEHMDRVDDRLASMSDGQTDATTRLVAALNSLTDVNRSQGELMAAMNESIRIQLNFTTQQMMQQAALTQQVAHVATSLNPEPGPGGTTGVIKPVEVKE